MVQNHQRHAKRKDQKAHCAEKFKRAGWDDEFLFRLLEMF
jgi:hypothetical protein